MLSIGEFSKICSVTTKTLRHYDEIGLIKPVYINAENGYRYYDISQLKTMLKINKLKAYQFPLISIKEIICNNDNALLLKEISLKEKEFTDRIYGYNFIVKAIKKDIKNLEKGIDIMSYLEKMEVKLVEQKSINVLYSRQVMSIDEFDKYYKKLFEIIAKEKLTVTGCPLAIYHDKEFDPQKSDIELAVPIKENIKGTREIQGGLCATLTLKGPYSELPSCYAKLVEWIDKENYVITAPPYEVYLTNINDTEPEDFITDIYFPIKKG